MECIVGRPILAAAGFQPAHFVEAGSQKPRTETGAPLSEESRLKGGCSQDWLPHNATRRRR
jgi:hypothetical protein